MEASGAWEVLDSSAANYELDSDALRAALIDACKLWLAHDGLWFLEFEQRHGMDEAIEADKAAWAKFAALEAKRIMSRLGLEPGGGITALAECLRHRLYANICRFNLYKQGENRLKLRMVDCRVQDARVRRDMPLFPCKTVGMVEFSTFAKTVDPSISTECLQCPPDDLTEGGYCEWIFST
jgi:hypothetical protein